MATQKKRRKRDIEKNYPVKQFVKKLRPARWTISRIFCHVSADIR